MDGGAFAAIVEGASVGATQQQLAPPLPLRGCHRRQQARRGGAGEHRAFPWCFPYLASPKATFRQCSFHGGPGSFSGKISGAGSSSSSSSS